MELLHLDRTRELVPELGSNVCLREGPCSNHKHDTGTDKPQAKAGANPEPAPFSRLLTGNGDCGY